MANTVLELLFKPEKPKLKTFLTKNEISVKFQNILSGYGISQTSIEQLNSKDTSVINYKISVPQDLPVPVILLGLTGGFYDDGVEVKSKEAVMNGKSFATIEDNGSVILNLEFNIDKKSFREIFFLGFILDEFYDLSDNEMERILNIPEKFAVVLYPSEKSFSLKKKIIRSEKEFVTIINDELNEPAYKLSPGMEVKRFRRSLRSIISNFSDTKLFLIDENSEVYNSELAKLIEEGFAKRKMRLVKLGDFFNLKQVEGETLEQSFEKYLNGIPVGSNGIFVANANQIDEIIPLIEKHRKKGTRFVSPSGLNFGF